MIGHNWILDIKNYLRTRGVKDTATIDDAIQISVFNWLYEKDTLFGQYDENKSGPMYARWANFLKLMHVKFIDRKVKSDKSFRTNYDSSNDNNNSNNFMKNVPSKKTTSDSKVNYTIISQAKKDRIYNYLLNHPRATLISIRNNIKYKSSRRSLADYISRKELIEIINTLNKEGKINYDFGVNELSDYEYEVLKKLNYFADKEEEKLSLLQCVRRNYNLDEISKELNISIISLEKEIKHLYSSRKISARQYRKLLSSSTSKNRS